MNYERVKERFYDYKKAVQRLKEAINEDESNLLIFDGTIKRFEFTYELAWKLMKSYLEYQGINNINSPRSALKEAYFAGLIKDGDVWLDMINARNLSAHTYNEQTAKEIYSMVKHKFFFAFLEFASTMEELLK